MHAWVHSPGATPALVEVLGVDRLRRATVKTFDGRTGRVRCSVLYIHGGLCKCLRCRATRE